MRPAALPPTPWKPIRAHEDYSGPYFDIDPEERAEYDARPFTGIEAPDGTRLVNAHDRFSFAPGVAELLALAPELAASLRETVAALEAAGADGEPGGMPSPALDRARLLLARLDGAA